MEEKIRLLWHRVYGNTFDTVLTKVLSELNSAKKDYPFGETQNPDWYKDAVIYSTYVDHFAHNFDGMQNKLEYLQTLGINTLWFLPILESPMADQGFDISNYKKVRSSLGGTDQFTEFLSHAHEADIRVIFDMALNHTSNKHPWFQSACSDKNSPYRNFYIWNDSPDKYKDARLLFKGMVNSNWEYNQKTGDYYFHRFYGFQPDLNYGNAEVFLEMLRICIYWQRKGVDGLRMDAIPFLWKEEHTDCENRPKTHTLIKLFRACLDSICEGTMLIAEANMRPKHVVEYFGNGDECHTAYHFPLMPRFYLAIAEADDTYITRTISEKVTPPIPDTCQWLSFLRCHDELTLEFVNPEEREKMNQYFLKSLQLSFREGEGIAGRLFNLLDGDTDKILTMYSMLFTTIGTPIIYYGDEIGAENDSDFFDASVKQTGYTDARFYNRGPMPWDKADKAIQKPLSPEGRIFSCLKDMIHFKHNHTELFRAASRFPDIGKTGFYTVRKETGNEQFLAVHNLTDKRKTLNISGIDAFTGKKYTDLEIAAHTFKWILLK